MLGLTDKTALFFLKTHLFAFIGSDAGVCADVPLQIAALRERLGTLHAAEGLLNDAIFANSGNLKMLKLNVTLQIGFLKVCLWTRVAFERADTWRGGNENLS